MRGYLGNQGRNRPKGGGGQRHGGNRDGNRDGNRMPPNARQEEPMDHAPFIASGEDAEIISAEELAQSRNSMNLTQLKSMPIGQLVELAQSLGVEASRAETVSALRDQLSNAMRTRGPRLIEIIV